MMFIVGLLFKPFKLLFHPVKLVFGGVKLIYYAAGAIVISGMLLSVWMGNLEMFGWMSGLSILWSMAYTFFSP